MKVTRIEGPRCEGGEQPIWDEAAQALYYIDNFGQQILRYDPASGKTATCDVPSVITSLGLRAKGGLIATMRSGIEFVDFGTGAREMVAPLGDPPPIVYNDARVDRRGRWIIGACTANADDPAPDGGLMRLDPDLTLTRLDEGIHFSNSNCFSPDGKTLYFSDSWIRTCYAYDYDIETGGVSNRRTFVDTTELGGMPDGAAVDSEGCVWMAIYGAGKIAAFRPDGSLERVIDMPCKLVSSVCFGGPDLDRLYATTISHGIHGAEKEEAAGYLYAIDGTGRTGLPEHRFAC